MRIVGTTHLPAVTQEVPVLLLLQLLEDEVRLHDDFLELVALAMEAVLDALVDIKAHLVDGIEDLLHQIGYR